MTPSQPIDDRSDRRHSRWFVSSNGSARGAALDLQLAALPIRALTIQPTTTLLRLHPSIASNRSPLPLRANLLHLHAAAKDAMRRTKGRLSLLHSPSSHRDVRRPANGSCNH